MNFLEAVFRRENFLEAVLYFTSFKVRLDLLHDSGNQNLVKNVPNDARRLWISFENHTPEFKNY